MSSSEQPEKPGQTRTNRGRLIFVRLRMGCSWCGRNPALLLLMLAILIAVVLVFRILFAPVEIGTPATESEALVRSNERLIQIVQWTISTVLVIGGGLIGLNWYRDEKRYERDRQEVDRIRKDLDDFRRQTSQHVLDLSQETVEAIFFRVIEQMTRSFDLAGAFQLLSEGYAHISQWESPGTYRTEMLIHEGLEWLDLLNSDLGTDSVGKRQDFISFMDRIAVAFPEERDVAWRLRSRA